MSQKQGRPSQTIESRFRKKEAETHRHTAFFLKKRCRQFYACTLKFSFLLRISNYLYLRCLKSRFIVAKHQYARNHADKQQRTNFKSRTNGKSWFICWPTISHGHRYFPDKRNKKPPGTNKINKPSLYLIKINKHGTNTPNKANHGKTATQYHKKLSRDSKPLTLCGRLRLCRTTAARTKNSLVSHLCAAMSTIFRTLYLCFFKIILDELSSVKTFCVVCDINFLWIKNFAKVSNITETAALWHKNRLRASCTW